MSKIIINCLTYGMSWSIKIMLNKCWWGMSTKYKVGYCVVYRCYNNIMTIICMSM